MTAHLPKRLVPVILSAVLLTAGSASGQIVLESIATVDSPLFVTHAGDDRLFIVQRTGEILVYTEANGVLPTPFLDLSASVVTAGEGGMLSMAFHPNYASNGRFYVSYTDNPGPGLRSVIARYEVSGDPNVADAGSGVTLLTLDQPANNHNGGQLQFGPDGYLYISFGDGGGAGDQLCRAQQDGNLFGKLLRIDVDQNAATPPYYGIPADNPHTGAADPGDEVPDEVWARGLRNPWRFSFDRNTGDMYIGDVGQDSREEIDRQPAASSGGENYGWKVMEGFNCFDADPIDPDCPAGTPSCFDPAFTDPIFDYGHGNGNCSVTGGYVYRGARVLDLQGLYLFGDLCTGLIWSLEETSPGIWERELVINGPNGLTSFGEDVDGDVYVTAGNTVYRFDQREDRQTLRQARCIIGMNRWYFKLGAFVDRDAALCLRAAAFGRSDLFGDPATARDCLTNDVRGTIGLIQDRIPIVFDRFCTEEPPDFGFTDDPVTASDAVAAAQTAIYTDIFGTADDLDLAERQDDLDASVCQQGVARAAQRLARIMWREFVRCKIFGVRGRIFWFTTNTEVEECIGDDARGIIQRGREILLRQAERRCEGARNGPVPFSRFAGVCSTATDSSSFTDCVSTAVETRVEEAIRAADGL